ncbi:hypothetical protein ACIPWY_31260 [Streptomyces sp. NPDC090032]|uniref:hypothetical protein n=1 Tax=Streptomyces sp. NPDC090032 TaxID=3365925 RepID=UPI0037F3BCDB
MSADDAKGESSGVLGALGASAAAAAGATAAAAKAMGVEGETLSKFKRRVDTQLRDLEKSHAAPSEIATGTLSTGRLGTFDEADALHSSYTHMHTQLENLSKILGASDRGARRHGRRVEDRIRQPRRGRARPPEPRPQSCRRPDRQLQRQVA